VSKTALTVRSPDTLPVLVVNAGERAGIRFLEFFASAMRNPHTRRTYDLAWMIRKSPTPSSPTRTVIALTLSPAHASWS
jgi:hypothetical protein